MYTSPFFFRRSPHPSGPSALWEPSIAAPFLGTHSWESGDLSLTSPCWVTLQKLLLLSGSQFPYQWTEEDGFQRGGFS